MHTIISPSKLANNNRLILNMNDDIQFGYLDLNGIVG